MPLRNLRARLGAERCWRWLTPGVALTRPAPETTGRICMGHCTHVGLRALREAPQSARDRRGHLYTWSAIANAQPWRTQKLTTAGHAEPGQDRTCQAHPRPGLDGQNRQPIRSSAFILERKNQPSAGHMFCTMSVLLRRVNAYCLRILMCQQKDFVFSKLPIDQQTDKTFLFIPAVGRRYGPAVKQVLRFRQRPGMAHQGQTRMICRAGGS